MIEALIIIAACVLVVVIGLGLVIIVVLGAGKTVSRIDAVQKKLDEEGYGK